MGLMIKVQVKYCFKEKNIVGAGKDEDSNLDSQHHMKLGRCGSLSEIPMRGGEHTGSMGKLATDTSKINVLWV